MARIRTIKPEFWSNEDMSELSEPACLLAIGLLNYADDEGYFNANEKLIKAAIFPIREPSRMITVLISELSDCGYIELFSGSDGKHYGRIKSFTEHQVINKKKESKIKSLCLLPYECSTDTVEIPPGKEGKGREGKGKDQGESKPTRKRAAPPTKEIGDWVPDGLNHEAWAKWMAYRKAAGHKAYRPNKLSEGAQMSKLVNMAGGNIDLQMKIVEQSLDRHWSGLFKIKPDYNQPGGARDINDIPEPDDEKSEALHGFNVAR